jgi:hypothetical protein
MNEVKIGVTGTNDSGRVLNTAKTDVRQLGEEAQKSARKFVELGASEERAAAEAGRMSRKIDQLGDDAGQLARKLLEAGVASKIAAEQFARYGDKDALDNLRKAKKEISELSEVARHFTTTGSGGKSSNLFDDLFKDAPKVAKTAGKEASGTFASAWQGGIMDSFKALPPEAKLALAGSLAAVAVAATPFIVSAVNGAILAGVGAGGLAAGIAIQAKDPAVSGAFKDLGARIMADLQTDTKPFKSQLLGVAGDFGKSWDKIQPNIQGFFATIAPATSKLGQAISKSIEMIGPALEHAAPAMEKVLSAVAAELPEIAQQISKLFEEIGKHGDSASEAIKFILFNVEALIGGFVILTETVGPAADLIVHVAAGLGLIDQISTSGTMTKLSDGASHATSSFTGLSGAVYNTADAANALNSAFDRLFGETMNLDEANLHVKEGFLNLGKTIRQNNGSLDENTAKGQANREAILSQIQALEDQRTASIAAGNGTLEATKKANAAYLSQLQRIRDVVAANGGNVAELDKMIARYKQLAALPDITKNIQITTRYRTDGTPATGFSRYPGGGFAHGGIVGGVAAAGGQRNGLTKVGESGWEYVELPPGSRVYPHGESQRMDASGGGASVIQVVLDVRGSSGDYLFEAINRGLDDRKIIIRPSHVRAA